MVVEAISYGLPSRVSSNASLNIHQFHLHPEEEKITHPIKIRKRQKKYINKRKAQKNQKRKEKTETKAYVNN